MYTDINGSCDKFFYKDVNQHLIQFGKTYKFLIFDWDLVQQKFKVIKVRMIHNFLKRKKIITKKDFLYWFNTIFWLWGPLHYHHILIDKNFQKESSWRILIKYNSILKPTFCCCRYKIKITIFSTSLMFCRVSYYILIYLRSCHCAVFTSITSFDSNY